MIGTLQEPAGVKKSGASERSKFFYGWWIVAVAAIGLCFGYGPIIVYSIGVFIKPLSQELHANRGSISFAFTLANVMVSIGSPLAGSLADRFGARRIILIATPIFALLLVSAPLLPAKIWNLYVFYGLVGLVGTGTAPIPYGRVIARWFDRRRGLALGFMLLGIGCGAILMPALAQRLIVLLGWRSTYTLIGVLVLVVSLPVVALFLKNSPDEMGLLPDGAVLSSKPAQKQSSEEGLTWGDARRSTTFWLMACAVFLVGASVHGCVLHVAPMLRIKGCRPAELA